MGRHSWTRHEPERINPAETLELIAETCVIQAELDPYGEGWRHGDVIVDDTSNLFTFHRLLGWLALDSNQASARGEYHRDELAEPLLLLIRRDNTGRPGCMF